MKYTIQGTCNLNAGHITGSHVEFHCEGVPPEVMAELNLKNNQYIKQLIDQSNKQVEMQQDMLVLLKKNIEDQAERYHDLKASIERSRQSDPVNKLLEQADSALNKGEFDKAAELLEQLTTQEEPKVERFAANHFKTAQAHLLNFKPDRALPHLEKAWRYRPETFEYGCEYASKLQTLNQYDKSQRVYEELLTAQHPPPHLAQLLNCAAIAYYYTNQRSKAEQAYREASQIYRPLAEAQPAVYLPCVANTLNNLANLLESDSGRRGDAEKAYLEALKIYRQLAEAQPAVYLSYVGMTLNNLAGLLPGDSGWRSEAEQAFREALKIYRPLVDAQPDVLPNVATTLNNLANLLRYNGWRRVYAEQSYREALKIRRQLAEAQPAVFVVDLANTLDGFGEFYLHGDKPTQALVHLEEAIKLLRPYAAQFPHVHGGKQAYVLWYAAVAYAATGNQPAACSALREAGPLVSAESQYLRKGIKGLAVKVCAD